MRTFLAVLLLAAAAVPSTAATVVPGREAGSAGVGPILGVPFGVTGKFWLNSRDAAQGALGISDGDLSTSVDVIRHFEDWMQPKKGRIPLYAGLGLKIKSESSTFAGFRFVGGVSFFAANDPVEFFAEVAPVLRFAPTEGGAIDGAVGARWYFR